MLIVPYAHDAEGKLIFLLVKDKKFDEWTFISGTCKKRSMEHPIACAIRELKEETKEIVDIDLFTWPHHHISLNTTYEEPCSPCVAESSTTYHIYFIDINAYAKTPDEIAQLFQITKKRGKHFNENNELGFFHLDEFESMKLWKFITHVVMPDSGFANVIRNLR